MVCWCVGVFGAFGMGQDRCRAATEKWNAGILWLCKACGVLHSVTCTTLFFSEIMETMGYQATVRSRFGRRVKERVLLLFQRCTYADLNSTVAVLRGLVYQLVLQERSLLHILRKRYNERKASVRGFECALYTQWHTESRCTCWFKRQDWITHA
jgi:hypothetical protein